MAAVSSEEHRQMIDAFPYPPYDIQKQLMVNVYEALRQRRVGLFESPTGTGKTLSLICSTVKWLGDERRAQEEAAAKAADEDSALPEWMQNHSAIPAEPVQHSQTKAKQKQKIKQQAKAPTVLDDQGNDISEFLVTGEVTAADAPGSGSKRTAAEAGYISSSSDEQERDATEVATADPAAQQPASPRSPQLIFCSRTHSQLSQFVGELHRTKYADSVMLLPVGSRKALCVNDEVLKLQNLSQINERCLDLQRNKSSKGKKTAATEALNNTSQQVSFMQQSSKRRQRKQPGSSGGCPYLSTAGAAAWEEFTDMVTAAPIDVEELAKLGRKKQLCPYYGSRRAVPLVDVILAPYSTILMPDARESMGIQLKDAVLVFDEAHNLLDAINGAHSTAVTAWQLLSVQRSLTAYYERFKSFLNPANAQNIQLMLRIAAALHKCLNQPSQHQRSPHGSSKHGSNSIAAAGRVVTVNDLLFELDIDNINMFELAGWVRDNKMAFKVSGYTAAATTGAEGAVDLQRKLTQGSQQGQRPVTVSSGRSGPRQAVSSTAHTSANHQAGMGQLSGRDGVSAIHSFVSFLLSLTNSDQDGRVIIQPATATEDSSAAAAADAGGSVAADQGSSGRGSHMRYILLNAARHFGRVLASARSVVLISGTLAPIDGLKAQLFPDIPPERLLHFVCGHVVPADQLLAVSIGRGPSGRTLNLRHENRNDPAVIDELGQLLLNMAAVVPEGLVVFAPSFGYLEQLVSRWSCSGAMVRLQQRKQVFREPRSATEVEQVLTAYAAAVTAKHNSSSRSSHSSSAAQPGDEPSAAAGSGAVTAAVSTAGSLSSSSGGAASPVCGAVMLCVVGGKLSEGINFGDGLGRCVVILGMPYPNPSDPELKERMNYLDRQAAAAAAVQGTSEQLSNPVNSKQRQTADSAELSNQQQQQQRQLGAVTVEAPRPRTVFQAINRSSRQPSVVIPQLTAKETSRVVSHKDDNRQGPDDLARTPATAAAGSHCCLVPAQGSAGSSSSSSSSSLITGREYYDDLCFKAVNQCVGRVVRHRGDYAAIVLVDSRWVVSPTEWTAVNAAEQQSKDQAAAVTQHERQQQQLSQAIRGEGGSSLPISRSRRLPVQKLPGWVQKSYVATSGDFGQAHKQLAQFFRRRQAQQ